MQRGRIHTFDQSCDHIHENGKSGKSLGRHDPYRRPSEFGRTIHGNVDEILKMNMPEEDKKKQIDGQDISQHWKVTSAAFVGGSVRGNAQFGSVGERTLLAIPLLPDGSLDPAYEPRGGELVEGRQKDPNSFIPSHGDVYATALYLSGINPKGRGRCAPDTISGHSCT